MVKWLTMSQDAIQIFYQQPDSFYPKVEVAACYVEIDGKLLLLERSSQNTEANCWGVPAGRIEAGETAEEGAKRELFEETGILVNDSNQIRFLGVLYIKKPEIHYIFRLFKVDLKEVPAIQLALRENQNYIWADSHIIEKLPLMAGADEALKAYRSFLLKNRPTGTSVCAYLLLKKGDQILLNLRKNTGYADGMWSFIAGHVEDGETATEGMIREAKEEIGITIQPEQLKVVHIMHRLSNRFNVDIFFECFSWEGEIKNREPHKCERMDFFPIHSLPTPLVDYNRAVLELVAKGEFYSERGWK